MKYFAISAGLAATLVLIFTVAGGPEALGAHPQWALKVGILGIVPGLAVGPGMVWLWSTAAAARVLAALWLASGLSVLLGKQRFVQSFAEDALAGRFWFIGWIVLIATLTATLAVIIRKLVKAHQPT